MNNLTYNNYQAKYNNIISYQQNINLPLNQIPQNYEYFQGMMPIYEPPNGWKFFE